MSTDSSRGDTIAAGALMHAALDALDADMPGTAAAHLASASRLRIPDAARHAIDTAALALSTGCCFAAARAIMVSIDLIMAGLDEPTRKEKMN